MCSYSFAPSGRFYCCTYVRRAMPWADVSLPLRGVGSITFRRICYPPVLSMRISNPYIRCCRIQKSGRTLSKGTRSMRLAPPHSPCSQQTDGLRSSLLAFKTKWRKKGQNTSAQGNALGINTLPTIAQNGQKNYPVYLPFASAVVVGCHSFATFGATI